eukprot:Transcript_671.p1 GENE.Transcript_671~~Transcript_671.p1  ORF type:complete len:319 (+),score=125.53 Transcript_671:145-1101(+)
MVVDVGIGRVLREHEARINSIDFSKDGELLLTAGDDCRVCLYSCQHGTRQHVSQCRKYGVDSARFTHDPLSVIAASRNDFDDAIRYLSLHDNRYLRFFKGHTDRVVALEMSPKEDSFASAAADDTVRLWDLRTTDCTGVMRFSGGHRAAIAFDPQGLVFAAAGGGGQTKLFDVRAYGKGPFTTFAPDVGGPVNFSCVKFSYDGKLMLLGTTQGTLLLLDAFNGELVRSFSGHDNAQQLPLEACFSPDADFVLSGSEDGTIWRWRVQSGEALPALQGHAGPVGALKVNPTRMMLASACSALCLWLPLPQQQQPTGMMGQ